MVHSERFYDLESKQQKLREGMDEQQKKLNKLGRSRRKITSPYKSKRITSRNAKKQPIEPKKWNMEDAKEFIKEHENDQPKEQKISLAMDEEEDLEDLTDGELEEIEKNLANVKRKLGNLITAPDVYPSEVVGDKGQEGIDEYKKQTKPIKQILAEGQDEVKQRSRANDDMYKTSKKVPQNNRVIHPSEGRIVLAGEKTQQSILNPENFGEVSERIKKLKETVEKTTNQQINRLQKPREDTDDSKSTNVLGTTKLTNTFVPKKGGTPLAYGMTEPNSPTDVDMRKKLKLPSTKVRGQKGQVMGTTTKLTPLETERQSDYLLDLMRRDDKTQFYKEIGIESKDGKPDKKIDKKPEPKKEIPEGIEPWKRKIMELNPNSKYWKEVNTSASEPTIWENWLEKYVETDKDKLNATKLNENRAVKEGKVRPPTAKHLVKPAWKAWLEKDQGQGDARYGNPHETGMEDPRVLQTSKDDFSMEEKEEEKDDGNKPYIERNGKTE